MLNRIRDNSPIYYGIIAVIVLISWLIIHYWVAPQVIFELDAGKYFYLAQVINAKGLGGFSDTLRTYGYPLFISIILRFNPTADIDQSAQTLILVQFFFHTLTSFLAVSILKQFNVPRRTLTLLALTAFALVQLNAVLLGLTHDMLTDSLTVFLVTAFFWIAISKLRSKWFFVGILLATATIVRPFHETWALAYAGFLLFVYLLRALAQSDWKPLPAVKSITDKLKLKTIVFRAIQIVLPILLLVGLQYGITYKNEGVFGIVGTEANQFLRLHLQDTFYTYKYETYVGTEPHATGVYYVASNGKTANQDSTISPLEIVLKQPISVIAVLLTKVVGLFQNYEWSTYRTTLINQPNIVFWWGLVPFTVFVYIFLQLILRFDWQLRAIVFNPAFVILSGAILYLVMYAVASIPEHRFVAPVIPVLTVYGVAAASDRRNWRSLILAICISCMLYFMTYQILLSSQT